MLKGGETNRRDESNQVVSGRENIALYGGSFDPIHIGHLMVAQAAFEEAGIDWMFFIPAAQSPFKPDRRLAPASLRVRWLRLALAGWSRCSVDLSEIERGGISYTIDTVRRYRQLYPQARLFWIIGGDHLAQLPQWKDAAELATLTEFLVVPRVGVPKENPPKGFQVHFLQGCPMSISSSEIRARLRQNRPVRLFLPPAAADAIESCDFYRKGENQKENRKE